jgi:hypothetical protein
MPNYLHFHALWCKIALDESLGIVPSVELNALPMATTVVPSQRASGSQNPPVFQK